jgi:glyoxylase-like metal-dependent hydrolase (beta-lactamase superfamily II)
MRSSRSRQAAGRQLQLVAASGRLGGDPGQDQGDLAPSRGGLWRRLGRLVQRPVERGLCHSAEAELLAAPTRANTLADPYATDEIFTTLLPEPYLSTAYAVKAAPATRLLADGDVIDLGDRHSEVIHTPGHSPGGIALWEAATGGLIAGDIVYDGPLIEDCYHSDAGDYLRSMRRLLELPVRLVRGGQFPSYEGARHRQIIRG